MPDDVRDETARRVAYAAFNRVDKHEELCGERYGTINEKLEDIARKVNLVAGRWWWLLTGIIFALLAVIGWLADRAF